MNSPTPSRPAASNFRWIICALLFFSTTVNYMDRQVISYLKEFFCTAAEMDAGFAKFTSKDLNLTPFIDKLNDSTDAVSGYIKSNLSPATLAALKNYSTRNPSPLKTNLLSDLNVLIGGPVLYDARRFAGVTLRPETQKLLANPKPEELLHLNRLLLDDAYPREISRGGFGWSNSDYANVTTVFTGFYAGMTILAGWVIDKIGTKLGLALSLIIWSIFGIANAFVGSLTAAHMVVRSLFGIGEAGNFPASIKTVAEWFPKRERAFATGIFNSGSNVGAMISALFVPWCLIHFGDQQGWKMAFILTGAIGFIWLIFWFWFYAPPGQHKRISKAEYDYIHSDKDETKANELQEDKSDKKVSASLISFQGRLPAAGFAGVTSMLIFLCLFVHFISRMFPSLTERSAIILYAVVGTIALWVSFAAQVKRWHDLGKSGWFVLPNLLIVAGLITTVYLMRLKLGTLNFDITHFQWRYLLSPYAIPNLLTGVIALVLIVVLATRPGNTDANQYGAATTPGLLGYRQTWAFFFGKFFTDGVWWFYLFWLPDYLTKQFGMTKHEIMLPTFIVYGVAIFGSVYGGSIPMTLMKRGMPTYKARMTAMFIIALFPLTVLSTQYFANINQFGHWASTLAVAIICIGAAAHQAWSANLFTTVSDMFPKKSVGSVTGIGAMAGGLGGVIVLKLSGTLADAFKENPQHAYLIMFAVCALSYLTAWGLMKAFVPRHKPITDL